MAMGTTSYSEEIGGVLLKGLHVIEEYRDDTPELVKQTIQFAGRLAADAGASVYRSGRQSTNPKDPFETFLSEGKFPLDQAPANCLLLTHNDSRRANCVYITDQLRNESAPLRPETDLTIQARSGICHIIGDPQREPLKLGGHQVVSAGGYSSLSALIALWLKQQRFSQTDRVDVNLFGVMAWVNWKAIAFGALGTELKREGESAEWPVFKLRDGHAAMVFFEPQWDAVCELIGDPRLRDDRLHTFQDRELHRELYQGIIADWFASRTKVEVCRLMDEAGIPNGVISTPVDILDDPLVKHRGGLLASKDSLGRSYLRPKLPHRIYPAQGDSSEQLTSRPPLNDHSCSRLPLSGIRVIDLGIITAGAGAGALLADLGADVVKVESPTYPDPFRKWSGSEEEDSPLFRFNNRNKRGIALDLKMRLDREQFFRLVAQSDIVIENFRRGVLERLGIDFDTLRKVNPRILLVSLSGQGLSGPGSQSVSFGSSLEARSGIASLTHYSGSVPHVSGRNLNYPDQIVCLYAAGVVMGALRHQQQTNRALHVDVSQRDVAIYSLSDRILAASITHLTEEPSGNEDSDFIIQNLFKTLDNRWIAISVKTSQIEHITSALNLDNINNLDRWIAQNPAKNVLAVMTELQVACAESQTGIDLAHDPDLSKLSSFTHSPSDELVKGFPFQFKDTPMSVTRDSPTIGQHNDEILSNV